MQSSILQLFEKSFVMIARIFSKKSETSIAGLACQNSMELEQALLWEEVLLWVE
ncbi:MAG: hypothetical protein RIR73_2066 [Chloroflexota bacterium]